MSRRLAVPIRLARARVDVQRRAIATLEAERGAVADRLFALAAEARSERQFAAATSIACAEPWFDWQRRTATNLTAATDALDARLAAARAAIRGDLAALRALEVAQDRHLADERRRRTRLEQSTADDRAATLFLAGQTA